MFLNQFVFKIVLARSSVVSKQGTFTNSFRLTNAEEPQIESAKDRAQSCFKNEWIDITRTIFFNQI